MTHVNPEPIRVRLAKGEAGWVIPLSGQLALVRNIPYAGPYNLGDVVELRHPDEPGGDVRLGNVVYRQYARRSIFFYSSPGQFDQVLSLLALFDAHVEDATGMGPASTHGAAMVAHHDDLKVDQVAALVGMEARASELSGEMGS
jgi:hypothetical protein